MKRRDFERHLRSHNATPLRAGGDHSYWGFDPGRSTAVPATARLTSASRARSASNSTCRLLPGRADRDPSGGRSAETQSAAEATASPAGLPSNGSTTRTRVPIPGSLSIASSPPSASTRSDPEARPMWPSRSACSRSLAAIPHPSSSPRARAHRLPPRPVARPGSPARAWPRSRPARGRASRRADRARPRRRERLLPACGSARGGPAPRRQPRAPLARE